MFLARKYHVWVLTKGVTVSLFDDEIKDMSESDIQDRVIAKVQATLDYQVIRVWLPEAQEEAQDVSTAS